MHILYLRYNKSYINGNREKIDKKIAEAKESISVRKLKIIEQPVTSGKKLSKKEIESLVTYMETKGVEKIYISNTNEASLTQLYTHMEEKKYTCEVGLYTSFYVTNNHGIKVEIINLDEESSSGTSSKKKVLSLMHLLMLLQKRGEKGIYPEDIGVLQDITEDKTSDETLKRYLNDLKELYPRLIEVRKNGNRNYYVMLEKFEILEELMLRSDAVEEISSMVGSLGESSLKKLSASTKSAIQDNNSMVLYKTRAFEHFEDSAMFSDFKWAIKKNLYVDIYDYQKSVDIAEYKDNTYEKVIPLKIIYMENNWYLSGVVTLKEKESVRFFRLRFIEDYKIHDIPFKKNLLKNEYYTFLDEFETLFTLYDQPFKPLKLKVSKSIASYFKGKKHFPKQSELHYNDDGSATFEAAYTQPMEVLPNIKKWLPDIEILSSEDGEIEDILKEDLLKALACI